MPVTIQPETDIAPVLADIMRRLNALETSAPAAMAALVTTGLMDHTVPSQPFTTTPTEISATRTPSFTLTRPQTVYVVPMAVFWIGSGTSPYGYLQPIIESTSNYGTAVASGTKMINSLSGSPTIVTDSCHPFSAILQPGTYVAAFTYYLNNAGSGTSLNISEGQIDVYTMGS